MEEEKTSYFSRLKSSVKKMTGRDKLLCILLIAAIIFLIYTTYAGKEKEPASNEVPQSTQEPTLSTDDLETRLAETLQKIDGVGSVSVMITYDGSSEKVTAESSTQSQTTTTNSDGSGTTQQQTQKTPVTTTSSGTTNPVIIKEIAPNVKGVIIVAQGAELPDIRIKLQQAAQCVLGIEAANVKVFEMGQ